MKLSKLYCNIETFKNITFNLNSLNVIYADVQSNLKDKHNSHCLGKTKLSALIDFLLLKKIRNQQKYFLYNNVDKDGINIFKDYVFYLELLLNSGEYLTIKRSVQNNTKISFSLNEARTKNYNEPDEWDFVEVSLDKAREILSEYLSLNFFFNKPYSYRKGLSYCLRTPPQDYADVYQLSKFSVGKDLYWKPFMFDLLGFDGELLIKKYQNDIKREEINIFVDTLKHEYSIKPQDRDDYVAQLQLIEVKASEIEKKIDNFNFYENDKDLINKGIDEIENSISELNSLSYNLNYDINRLELSIKNNFAFNINKVAKIFDESKLFFPEQLTKDYTALIDFNKKLTIERNKFIKKTLRAKRDELEKVNTNLFELNNKKENLLSYIQDTDTFKKFKQSQKELAKTEEKLQELKEKLHYIDLTIKKNEESNDLVKEIEDTVKQLKIISQTTEKNEMYLKIRSRFSFFYKKIMDEAAIIYWHLNSNNNVEFMPPKVHEKDGKEGLTAKDEGTTYKKLLCVAFDLAILVSYNDDSYFRFVYHDDVLSQQDNGIKQRLLTLIREIISNFDLQYILSVIKSDLPTDSQDKPIFFSEKEIILNLTDKDESGTLFGFEF